jgi:hypothetical protein
MTTDARKITGGTFTYQQNYYYLHPAYAALNWQPVLP